jgi:hypothetical protein
VHCSDRARDTMSDELGLLLGRSARAHTGSCAGNGAGDALGPALGHL